MLRCGLGEYISTEIPSDGDIVCRSVRIDIARRVISVLSSPEYAWEYLEIAERIPHRNEGASVEYIPTDAKRIGTGDGRLIKLMKSKQQQH